MQPSLPFIRVIFFGLCILLTTAYALTELVSYSYYARIGIGLLAGLLSGSFLICLEAVFKRFNLRTFNIAALGLFFGFLMGKATTLILEATFTSSLAHISPHNLLLLQIGVYLFFSYFGLIMTTRASEELYLSIPFVKFKHSSHKKKDLLVDSSALQDQRLIDLAVSGLLDNSLVIPRFIIKDLYESVENADENIRSKARRGLDVIKRLEGIPTLEIRYADADFPETKDISLKLPRLARLLHANILTADANRLQQSIAEGIRIVNLHTLSSALKPLAQNGEYINIKIQRYGKEPRQGVGYMDDGTMVVVNGGAEYIGETIRSQVLSVKHTSSGRMIFCNALENNMPFDSELATAESNFEHSAKTYFAL